MSDAWQDQDITGNSNTSSIGTITDGRKYNLGIMSKRIIIVQIQCDVPKYSYHSSLKKNNHDFLFKNKWVFYKSNKVYPELESILGGFCDWYISIV